MDNLSAVPAPPDPGAGGEGGAFLTAEIYCRVMQEGDTVPCCVFGFHFIINQKSPSCALSGGEVLARGRLGLRPRGGPRAAGTLTLVADEEAHAGPAAVRGEEQRQERAGADQEVRRLRAVELADERRRRGRPVAHLQRVVVHLGLKPAHR